MRCGGPRSNPYFSVLQYGRLNQQSALQSLDAVVPHFLDPSDFPFEPTRKPAGYLLFLGRLSQAKGVDLAIQIARASGLALVVAGQAESGPGVQDWDRGTSRGLRGRQY